MLEVSSRAPSFELQNHEGETVRLEDYRGRWLVLYFYPRADTPGCTSEACGFRDAFEAFDEQDVAVAGVSDDGVEAIAAFREKYDLPFELLSDPDGGVGRAYESYGERSVGGQSVTAAYRNTYLIDPEGEIARTFEGVSPGGHAEEVLDALDQVAGERAR